MIVVLTATEAAHAACRGGLTGVRVHEGQAGTLFDVGSAGGHPVALALVGKGNQASAALTERAITEFSPDSVFFVGEAGSLHSWVEPGDVVVATKVYAYHGGREDADGFKNRPDAWQAPHRLEQRARLVARSFPAQVHFAPIAAGEILLAPGSATAAFLDSGYNDAAAVDTESAGAAGAAHLNDATPMLTIRSIGTPVPAAEFVVALVAALPATGRTSPGRTGTTNISTGDVHGVLVQAGNISGGVHTYHGTADTAFVTALTEAARSGILSEATYTSVMLALHEIRARPSDPAPRAAIRELLSGHPDLLDQL